MTETTERKPVLNGTARARTHRLMISLSPVENAALKTCSAVAGESMAAFTRRCLRANDSFTVALAAETGKGGQ